MVEESGDPDGFDARAWLNDWLQSAIPALGGRKPVDYLHSPDGIALITQMLNGMQTGAYF
ncbi:MULTISPECIES: MbcA/ParS/Xre antitoxin family protein [Burkholderia]|uniref:MbcA/ParS/Xre antitoxin family protein n=1 Tax=Burkholderia TaxID=32008 RepID=UPI0022B41710|nr:MULTISPECIES: MbcA/ParS/Xre antitoxin family protein [Burkholderia]MEB2541752.1 MbcA/ParS/Xre antitoxin family protein [Burkholderia cenocepacia]